MEMYKSEEINPKTFKKKYTLQILLPQNNKELI